MFSYKIVKEKDSPIYCSSKVYTSEVYKCAQYVKYSEYQPAEVLKIMTISSIHKQNYVHRR